MSPKGIPKPLRQTRKYDVSRYKGEDKQFYTISELAKFLNMKQETISTKAYSQKSFPKPAKINDKGVRLWNRDQALLLMRERLAGKIGQPQVVKLTFQKAEEIRAIYAAGEMGYKTLGAKYGVNASTIKRIIKGEFYAKDNGPQET